MTGFPWKHPCWIVCTPRSGSTLLADLLNRAAGVADGPHPQTVRFKEHYHPAHPERLADGPPLVTKCHIHWIEEHIDRLPSRDTRIILLTRENRHAQALSLIASGRTGIHSSDSGNLDLIRQQTRAVQMTVGEVWDHVAAVKRWERLADLLFQHYERTAITYEDLCEEPEATLSRLIGSIDLLDKWTYDPSPLKKLSPAQEVSA